LLILVCYTYHMSIAFVAVSHIKSNSGARYHLEVIKMSKTLWQRKECSLQDLDYQNLFLWTDQNHKFSTHNLNSKEYWKVSSQM
jgi:hypothetical protein